MKIWRIDGSSKLLLLRGGVILEMGLRPVGLNGGLLMGKGMIMILLRTMLNVELRVSLRRLSRRIRFLANGLFR